MDAPGEQDSSLEQRLSGQSVKSSGQPSHLHACVCTALGPWAGSGTAKRGSEG